MNNKVQQKIGQQVIEVVAIDGVQRRASVKEAVEQVIKMISVSDYETCLHYASQIYQQVPKYFTALHILVEISLRAKELDSAEKYCREWLRLDARNNEAALCLTRIYREQDNYQAALDTLKKCLKLSVNYAPGFIELGMLYREIGDQKRALNAFDRAIQIAPLLADCYFHKTLLPGVKFSESDLLSVQGLLNSKNTEPEYLSALYFSLSRHHEKNNNDKQFMDVLSKANAIKKNSLNYSFKQDSTRNFDLIKQVFSNELIRQYDNDPALEKLRQVDDIIFICGFPRSGSSLVEQILSAHPEVNAAGESGHLLLSTGKVLKDFSLKSKYPFWVKGLDAQMLNSIQCEYLSAVSEVKKTNFLTEKSLGNMYYIGLIKILFPKAKIIHCYRNPVENCFSCFKKTFDGSAWPFIYDLNDLTQAYKNYHSLMKYWDKIFPDQLLHVANEDLITSQYQVTKIILDYCGLDWSDNCLDFTQHQRAIRTASASQIRSGLFDSPTNEYQKYSSHLTALEPLKALQRW